MVIKRKISKERYIVAGILTILIFSLGLSLGTILSYERLQWVEKASKEQEINYQSMQFQYLYLTSLKDSNESCAVLQATLENSVLELSKSLDKLTQYEKDANINKDDYALALRKYIVDNLKYWLIARETKDVCNADLVNVLYFFSTKTCPRCPEEGTVLTYFKKKFGERLLIFPLDVDIEKDEKAIEVMKRRYNVTVYPTIIVEEQKYENVISKEELGSIICNSFADLQPECGGILEDEYQNNETIEG